MTIFPSHITTDNNSSNSTKGNYIGPQVIEWYWRMKVVNRLGYHMVSRVKMILVKVKVKVVHGLKFTFWKYVFPSSTVYPKILHLIFGTKSSKEFRFPFLEVYPEYSNKFYRMNSWYCCKLFAGGKWINAVTASIKWLWPICKAKRQINRLLKNTQAACRWRTSRAANMFSTLLVIEMPMNCIFNQINGAFHNYLSFYIGDNNSTTFGGSYFVGHILSVTTRMNNNMPPKVMLLPYY